MTTCVSDGVLDITSPWSREAGGRTMLTIVMFRTTSHTTEFSAVAYIFNLFLRLVTSWLLYWDWGDRRGLVAVTVTKNTEGGSVRSGSVLTHYPGEVTQ